MLDEPKIVQMYLQMNLTIRQIADQVGCSYEPIRQILKRNGVQWRKKFVSSFSQNQVQDIISQYQNGITIRGISKQYQISVPAISRLLKANGVQVISMLHKYDDLREIPISDLQKQFLVGILLGDGCLYRDTEKSNYKLSFGHCDEQKEYFEWCISIMKPFVTRFSKDIDKRGNSIMWQTATISHPDFNEFGRFYDSNRIKMVPSDLDQYFTPITLATWVMDDGSLNAGVNMRMSTMSFTKKEHYILQDYLSRIFGIQSNVNRYNSKYFQLCMNKENTKKLSDIIRPYIVPCMQYKIMA